MCKKKISELPLTVPGEVNESVDTIAVVTIGETKKMSIEDYCTFYPSQVGGKGEKGDKGDKGMKGCEGSEGSIGRIGPKGNFGGKGDVGPKGEKGIPISGLKGDPGRLGNFVTGLGGESHNGEFLQVTIDGEDYKLKLHQID